MAILEKGKNDLQTLHPELAIEWNTLANEGLLPSDVTAGSNKRVWWKCEKGHEWQACISSRTSAKGNGCPFCSNKRVRQGYNDLASTDPLILEEWDYSRNTFAPTEISRGSGKKAWWICRQGHSYEAPIADRLKTRKRGCPYCVNQRLLLGYNDLLSRSPELAAEWHPLKNGDLAPSDIFPNHHEKVWWMCPQGHEYQATPLHRFSGHTGCPICAQERQTSFPEQAILYYASLCFQEVSSRFIIDGFEFDIYVADCNMAIEYDGMRFHKGKKIAKDNKKNKYAREHGIDLYRFSESADEWGNLEGIDKDHLFCVPPQKNYSALEEALSTFLYNKSGKKLNVDFSQDYSVILEKYITEEKANSLAAVFPDIALEWHPSKNGTVTPEKITKASNHVVWWKCSQGHEYRLSVNNRISGTRCPYCSGSKALKGFNSFGDSYPHAVKEWHPLKNGEMTSYDYLPSSNKKVWWLCSRCGTEFQRAINKMARSYSEGNKGCPVCSKRVLISGHNDFAAKFPDIACEWHPQKNEKGPQCYSSASIDVVWWQCPKCGQDYQSSIGHRTQRHSGCPYCTNVQLKLLVDVTDLQSTHPDILDEWDTTANTVSPREITARSHYKAHWICSKGHKYTQEVYIHLKGHGCPYCSNRRVLNGYNDIESQCPELLLDWDWEKNAAEGLNPSELSKWSRLEAWWKCPECGFSWKRRIANQYNCRKCPNCKYVRKIGDEK